MQRACGFGREAAGRLGEWVSKMPLDRFTVLLERSGDEYFAYVTALPGCTSGGRTQGEAIENVKEAIRLTLEYRREHGLPLPEHVEMVAEVEV